MNTGQPYQRFMISVLCCLLLTTILFGSSSGGTVFFDDFSDGDAEDGAPVTWVPRATRPGNYHVSSGDFVFTMPEGATGRQIMSAEMVDFELRDTSMRAQLRMVEGRAIVVGIRAVPDEYSYFAGILSDGRIFINRADDPPSGVFPNLAIDQSSYQAFEQDFVLQLDAMGDELSFWIWPAGESMPSEPQLTTFDETYEQGGMLLSLQADDSGRGEAIFRWVHVATESITDQHSRLPGDFNHDGLLDAQDIDRLSAEVRSGANPPSFDVNLDGLVDRNDRVKWVKDIRKTYFGDANLDGEFTSADFVQVFQAGHYEDNLAGNSMWATGDWNGDAEFDSADFVVAFQDGGYELGPRAATSAVPETSGLVPCLVALALLGCAQRRAPAKLDPRLRPMI